MRKIALLTGAAGALLLTGPALAQEATPPVPQEQPAQPQSVSLTPGATVRGEGGVELGKLEGIRTNAAGQQELTVRGADGQLRAVSLTGFQMQGSDVAVAATLEAYMAGEVIPGEAAAPPAGETTPPTPPVEPPPADQPTPPVNPMDPPVQPDAAPVPEPVDPADPTTTTDPMVPGEAEPPKPDR